MPEIRNDLLVGRILQTARDAALSPSVLNYSSVATPGFGTAPAIALTTVAVTNPFGCRCMVYIAGGTTTVIAVDGVATGLVTTPCSVVVEQGGTIAITYSAAPTWKWYLIP